MDDMETDRSYTEYQNNVLIRLARELETGKATNGIAGTVAGGDYEVLRIWTLTQLGYTGEQAESERLKQMVDYSEDFGSHAWGYLLEKYTAKAQREGMTASDAKKKFIATVKKGYKMLEKLVTIFNDNELKKNEEASKEESLKPHNKRWHED